MCWPFNLMIEMWHKWATTCQTMQVLHGPVLDQPLTSWYSGWPQVTWNSTCGIHGDQCVKITTRHALFFIVFPQGGARNLDFVWFCQSSECSICCWIFRNAFYPATQKKTEQIRESLKPRITHNSRQIQMTPYRLHGAPRPSRFPHRPGQNKLRSHQSFHK